MRNLRQYFTLQIALRLLADAVMVNVALFLGIALRIVGVIVVVLLLQNGTVVAADVRRSLVVTWELFVQEAGPLTAISLAVFAVSGFYSRGRYYASRYKVAVILQAVSLAYLIFGFFIFSAAGFRPPPRTALAFGWLFTAAALVGTRLWAQLWLRVAGVEARAAAEARPAEGRRAVLVIGGAGYIGSILTRQLLEKGYRVRVLDLGLYGTESIAPLLSHPHFQFSQGDSRDIEEVIRAMWGVDAVIHLGEIVGDPATTLDSLLTQEVNVAATRMVAEAARGFRVRRFIYASSCSVYGAGDGIFDEQTALNPVSLYARAKRDAERILLGLGDAEFHPVILRLATVFGMSPRPRFDLVANLLAAKAVQEGEITIFGGAQWRPFVHVSDVARAFVRALEAPEASVQGQIFNVGSDRQNYTIVRLGELVQGEVPEARVVISPAGGDPRNYRVSFAKIRRQLGFEPQVTVAEGVREVAAALRAGAVGSYAERRYSNYRSLSEDSGLEALTDHRINRLYAVPAPAPTVKDVPPA